MKKEEYKEKLKEIYRQMDILFAMKHQLRDDYVSGNKEFNIGDKVRVFHIKRDYFNSKADTEELIGEVFISGINDKYFSGDIDYSFNKIKKDGTMANQSAGIYGFSRLELVAPAKEEITNS